MELSTSLSSSSSSAVSVTRALAAEKNAPVITIANASNTAATKTAAGVVVISGVGANTVKENAGKYANGNAANAMRSLLACDRKKSAAVIISADIATPSSSSSSDAVVKVEGVASGVAGSSLAAASGSASVAGAGSATAAVAVVAGASASGPKPHRCEKCGKSFYCRYKLKVHSRTHLSAEDAETHSCKICAKPFPDEMLLRRKHQGPFECKHCTKKLPCSSAMRKHLSSEHTGPKPFECKDCGRTFLNGAGLAGHRSAKHLRHICIACGKEFSKRTYLKHHMQVHTGLKPYVCEECGRAFAVQGNLREHKHLHSGVRAFRCEVCGKSYVQRSALSAHRLVHRNDKRYRCDICGQAFRRAVDRNLHRATQPPPPPRRRAGRRRGAREGGGGGSECGGSEGGGGKGGSDDSGDGCRWWWWSRRRAERPREPQVFESGASSSEPTSRSAVVGVGWRECAPECRAARGARRHEGSVVQRRGLQAVFVPRVRPGIQSPVQPLRASPRTLALRAEDHAVQECSA
ncbi:hypothetical protein Ahia01_001325800 [Argonauta hians]